MVTRNLRRACLVKSSELKNVLRSFLRIPSSPSGSGHNASCNGLRWSWNGWKVETAADYNERGFRTVDIFILKQV